MSATDELRRMLDERGVEHYDGTECTLWGYEDYNEFTGIYRFSADETSDGHMQVRLWYVTPEQAIAATLGAVEYRKPTTLSQLEAENDKLREFASEAFSMAFNFYHGAGTAEDLRELKVEYRELGIEVG